MVGPYREKGPTYSHQKNVAMNCTKGYHELQKEEAFLSVVTAGGLMSS